MYIEKFSFEILRESAERIKKKNNLIYEIFVNVNK